MQRSLARSAQTAQRARMNCDTSRASAPHGLHGDSQHNQDDLSWVRKVPDNEWSMGGRMDGWMDARVQRLMDGLSLHTKLLVASHLNTLGVRYRVREVAGVDINQLDNHVRICARRGEIHVGAAPIRHVFVSVRGSSIVCELIDRWMTWI